MGQDLDNIASGMGRTCNESTCQYPGRRLWVVFVIFFCMKFVFVLKHSRFLSSSTHKLSNKKHGVTKTTMVIKKS